MITAFMLTFHRVYADSKPPPGPSTDRIPRYHAFQTNGELLPIPNEPNMEVVSAALRVLKRSDISGL